MVTDTGIPPGFDVLVEATTCRRRAAIAEWAIGRDATL